jgi:hypothetical protein
MKLASKIYDLFYGHPKLTGKCLVRAIQRVPFRARNAKNDLNPTYLVKRNFCFEMEGVVFSVTCTIYKGPKLDA